MSLNDLEKALRYSEARFRALFDDLPTMAVTLDSEGKMIMANQACVTQLGYAMEELVGHSVLNLFHPADRGAVLEKLRNCLKNRGQVHYWQFRKVTKDGVLLWVEEVVQAVHDLNGQVNVLVVCQDVSEQKRLKTEIEEAKRFSEVIVETLIEPLVVLNSEFIILSANHSFYDTFRIPRAKTIGTLIYDLGDRLWDIPALRLLLEQILPEHTVYNGYELEHDFLNIGPRTILINARRISRENSGQQLILLAMEDITERKRAEEFLRETARVKSEFLEKLNQAQQVAKIGSWEWDLQTGDLWCSEETCAILGTRQKVTGFGDYGNFIHPDDVVAFQVSVENALQNQDRLDVDVRLLAAGGALKQVNFKGKVCLDESGRSIRFIGTIMDITERKRAEEERDLQRIQLQAVLSSIADGVAISDPEGNVVTMNPAALAIHGYQSVEQVQQHLSQFRSTFECFYLDGRPVPFEEWPMSRSLRGDRFTDYEVSIRRKDSGKTSIVSYSGTPVQLDSGQVVLYVNTLHDITERKMAEREADRDRILLEEAEKLAKVGAWECDLLQDRFRMSREWLRIHGSEEPNPTWEDLIKIAHPEDTEAVERAFRDSKEKGISYQMVHRIVRPSDGAERIIQAYGHVVKDDRGRPVSIYGAAQDITEGKRSEEEIKRLNQELTERAAQLEAANKEQETFNHTVAHDLRQPLDLLSSYCQMIDRLCGDRVPEECLRYVHDAYNVTLQMNKLIRALLEFSHMSRIDLHRNSVDLSLLAQEVCLSLKAAEPQRDVEFRIQEGIVAECDPNLMRIVLNNLIGNSWKYTALREKGVVEFGMETVDDTAVFYVRDNGLGFEMADADKLFAPFQRLPGTEQTKGFGIGLATVERIIRRHGGRVWAEGEPGKGACIRFTLPAPEPRTEP